MSSYFLVIEHNQLSFNYFTKQHSLTVIIWQQGEIICNLQIAISDENEKI